MKRNGFVAMLLGVATMAMLSFAKSKEKIKAFKLVQVKNAIMGTFN